MKERKTQTGTATRDSTDRLLSRLLEKKIWSILFLFLFGICWGYRGPWHAIGVPPPPNDGPEIRT